MENLPRSWRRGFEAAAAVRQYSVAKTPSYKLGAALFNGSRLVSVGFNVYGKTHPSSRERNFDKNLHAEHAALIKRQHYDGDAGLVLYVYRENRTGRPVCSRPCSNCSSLARLGGVGRIRFVNEDGQFVEEKL
jgi:deoxycytidylate deaminase